MHVLHLRYRAIDPQRRGVGDDAFFYFYDRKRMYGGRPTNWLTVLYLRLKWPQFRFCWHGNRILPRYRSLFSYLRLGRQQRLVGSRHPTLEY